MARLIVTDKFGDILEWYEDTTSIREWMNINVPNYSSDKIKRHKAYVNGSEVYDSDYGAQLDDTDVVEIILEPQGPIIPLLPYIVAIASAAYAYNKASNIPDGYESAVSEGKSIYSPDAKGNRIEPMGIIREAAGKAPILYPDLICPPIRRYIGNEEFVHLMLNVSAGYMDLEKSNVYIAETPILNYADDIELDIFDPGEDVSGTTVHQNWYQTREISGLHLSTRGGATPGDWQILATATTVQTFMGASVAPFPFAIGEIFLLDTPSNQGFYEVISLSGLDNSVAEVIEYLAQSIELTATGTISSGLADLDRIILYNRNGSQEVSYSASGETGQLFISSTGLPGLTPAALESANISSENGGVNWEGGFQIAPQNVEVQFMEIDINFPQGLVEQNALTGDLENRTVEVEFQYREVGDAPWIPLATKIYNGESYDEIGITEEFDFGSLIRPEIRFRRVTRDSTDSAIRDRVYIRAIRCLLETKTSYPDITTMALRIRGTNALASTSENQINIRGATRKLPTLQEIQDAADGTPFDISRSATQTLLPFQVASAVGTDPLVTDMAPEVVPPYFAVADTGPSFDFTPDGLKLAVSNGECIFFYDLVVPFRPDLGTTLTWETTTSPDIVSVRYADDSSNFYLFFLQDDDSDYKFHRIALGPNYDPDGAVIPSHEFEPSDSNVVSFTLSLNGTRLWYLTANQSLEEYELTTPYDLSTDSFLTSYDLSTSMGVDSAESLWMDNYSGGIAQSIWVRDTTGEIFEFSRLGPSPPIFVSSYTIGNADEAHIRLIDEALFLFSTDGTGGIVRYELDDRFDTRATRNPIRFLANMLYERLPDKINSLVDFTQLATFEALAETREDYFDGEFVDQTTVWEAMRAILVPLYSEPVIREGLLQIVRDGDTPPISHLYTPDVMLDRGLVRADTLTSDLEPDGVIVQYLSDVTGQTESIRCELAGDTFINPKTIEIVGITDRTKAWRLGMRERRRLRLKPATLNFSTEMDALNSHFGDTIGVSNDLAESQDGHVVGVSGSTVTLSRDVVSTLTGPLDFIVFRQKDGTASAFYGVTVAIPANTITLVSPSTLAFVPNIDEDSDPTYFSFGSLAQLTNRAIVKQISPSSDGRVSVTAEEEIPEIYLSDNQSPPS